MERNIGYQWTKRLMNVPLAGDLNKYPAQTEFRKHSRPQDFFFGTRPESNILHHQEHHIDIPATMALQKLSSNRAVKMLMACAEGKYGVLGVVSYNMETIVAAIRAAEKKQAPLQILLFPWALKYSPLFVDFAAHAARKAKVPVTVHMDHAQDPEVIKAAAQIKAEDGTPAFDSIMVDMSHYEKEENLAKTKELVALCHSQGIATEAEPGRIEGGEDGVKDTAELEGMMTTPEEVDDFVATGIDFLAPAFGNVHGEYGGRENIHLDYDR